MHCSNSSPIGDKVGKSDVRHSATFVTGEETRAESVIVGRDKLVRNRGQFLTHMQRVGACEGGLKPAT